MQNAKENGRTDGQDHRWTSPDKQGEVSRPHPRSLLCWACRRAVWAYARRDWSGGFGICAGTILLLQACWMSSWPPVSLAVGALWLCGPPWRHSWSCACSTHRRISETGNEVAGIHGFFLGEEASTWDPMLKPEADSSQAGQPPPLHAPAPSAPSTMLPAVLPTYLLFVPDTQTVMSSFLSLNQSDHLLHHPQHI